MPSLLYARGELPERLFRFCQFMSQQEIDGRTGRILGRYGYDHRDGGMELADRYAEVTGLGSAQFWADLRDVARLGLAERVVTPAPGRKAVYALCLRVDAIPHNLPEDLAEELQVWQLPDSEPDQHEDAAYGRLSETASPEWTQTDADPVTVDLTARQAADLQAAPRWEHPAGTGAATAAQELAEAIRRAEPDERPRDLRCMAVAKSTAADRLSHRFMNKPETSPSYARELSNHVGFLSTGSSALANLKNMETTQRTRQRGAVAPFGGGDSLQAVASRVLRHCWGVWRRKLGRGRVILPSGVWGDAGEWLQRSAWSDLHRLIAIALRRSTEAELVELLTLNIADAQDLGRLSAFRLWRLINARRDAHGYGKAAASERYRAAWDDLTPTKLARQRQESTGTRFAPYRPDSRAQAIRAVMDEHWNERERQRVEEAAKRTEQYQRWGISTAPMREPEAQFRAALAPIEPEERRLLTPAEAHAAAVQRARTERGSRSLPRTSRPARDEAAVQAATERSRARWARLGINVEDDSSD